LHKRLFPLILALLLFTLPAHAGAKGVVLNFNDVDISTMVKFISDLTGRNFVMDDRVRGKISVYSPAKLSTDEAFNVFTSVLELKGFTVVPSGKVYKIVPTSLAKQSGTRVLNESDRLPVNDSYVAQVIPLENITASEAVPFLQPVVSKDGYISAFGPGNLLLAVDSALNMRKLLGIVRMIDNEQRREGAELIFLKNAAAEGVAGIVRDWIGSREKGARTGAQQAVATVVVADPRLNALVVFGSDNLKKDVRNLVSLVDVVPPTTSSKVNVHYLEHADAIEVAKVLEAMVKGLSATQVPAQTAQAPPQQSAFEGGKITITPDKSTNSLVVMASPADYQNLVQVIQKLDRRRRQVFVQALIAEVSLDKLDALGVQWGSVGGTSNNTFTVAGLYDPLNTFTPLLNALKGMKDSAITVPDLAGTAVNFSVVLKALASNDALNVLSTPNILTSDNKEAEIFVGENVPFLSQTNIISGGVSQQSVERKDTGITLKITPQVNEGEYVKLDIYQEISAVKESKGQATDLVTTKRSAKTSVVVKDNETVAIGGLIQERDNEVVNKVPFLGDIPLIGWLFKSKSITRKKTNLMILLTPQIIRDAVDLARVSNQQKDQFGQAVEKREPITIQEELQLKR
jgi:general secretion pathway protein D